MFVCCECCVLTGRGLCDGLITRPEESNECGVSECDREASILRSPWPTRGCCAMKKKEGNLCQPTFHTANILLCLSIRYN
jgi:hypothetical protein